MFIVYELLAYIIIILANFVGLRKYNIFRVFIELLKYKILNDIVVILQICHLLYDVGILDFSQLYRNAFF